MMKVRGNVQHGQRWIHRQPIKVKAAVFWKLQVA
jgi:hypothetical protein